MAFRRRAARRRIPPLLVLVVLALTTWYLVLPPESPVVLALHFNAWRVRHALGLEGMASWTEDGGGGQGRGGGGGGKYPVHIPSEVGCLIKTGYGTRHRVREQLRAFAVQGGLLGDEGRDFLVVGDWAYKRGGSKPDGRHERRSSKQDGQGQEAEQEKEPQKETDKDLGVEQIHDVVGLVMDSDMGRAWAEHDRFGKYRSLRGAVDAGDEAKAEHLGRKYGWELDALKFIKGMDMAYRRMPHKKWYMILDDDTFVVRSSLQALLRTLDPARPAYLGNSVGDYRARFAHGGSAVLVSGAAMKMLFAGGRPDLVSEAYARSLDETWGDRLVATTLQRLGVYIAEPYSSFFNGETPAQTRIRPERACLPIVSFHGLREPGAMLALGEALRRTSRDDDDDDDDSSSDHDRTHKKDDKPLLWGQLWDLFAQHPLHTYAAQQPPFRPGDHVGPGHDDDPDMTTWKAVHSADHCRRKCTARSACLAWSFHPHTRECRTSPWVIAGPAEAEADTSTAAAGTTSAVLSGVNWATAKSILRECR
ncbi:hypothetical protein E4U43_007816 [Claviceps pusilla]|uniref:N-acetylgalactosaminide beta-1,3-galactosyltransferase n=1 Tax=Claviceps pusilla TaxID=123648 RepID=A0A9P7NC73_9HYPO|nr:hypothetical protein E4U43_007816 [Claviceps pusilla]